MAIVPRSTNGATFRRAPTVEAAPTTTATEDVRDDGASQAFRAIRDREIAQDEQARLAVKTPPEKASRALTLSTYTGLPAGTALRNSDELEVRKWGDSAVRFMDRDPIRRKFFSDPLRVAAARDDFQTLDNVTTQVDSARPRIPTDEDVDQAFQRKEAARIRARDGQLEFSKRGASYAPIYQSLQRDAGVAAGDYSRIRNARDADKGGGFFNRMGYMFRTGVDSSMAGLDEAVGALLPESWKAGETAAQKASRGEWKTAALSPAPIRGGTTWEDVKARPTPGRLFGFITEQGARSVPGMFGAVTAMPVYALSLTGQTGRNRANANGREEASMGDILKAAPFAIASAYLEKVGAEKILFPVAKSAAGRIGAAAATEAGTEFAQSGIEYTGGALGTDKGFDPATAFDQALAGSVAGAGMGAGFRGSAEAAHTITQRAISIVQARTGERVLGGIFAQAEQSKLRQRNPSLFAEFLQAHAEGTAVENLFVPAEKLRELYQQNGWDWEDEGDDHFSPFTPDFKEQMQAGLMSGGDVVIPTAGAATYLAGSPEWEAIKGDVRVNAGSISSNEAARFEEAWAEEIDKLGERAAKDAQAEADQAAPRQKVFDQVFSMGREAGFSINASRAYADLWAERYQTRSERLDGAKDAFALFSESVAGIRQDLPGKVRDVYRKGDGLDVLINAMRERADPMKPAGSSLLDTIMEGGGIEDRGGDIRSMGGDKIALGDGKFGRTRKPLIREKSNDIGDMTGNALTPDEWALRLWEAGYFPDHYERPDINTLFDAIGEGLAGEHRYSEGAMTPAVEANNAIVSAANDLRNALFNADLDPDTATRAEIEAAIKAYDDGDIERGFDQTLPETIEIDGIERSTVNSEGQPLARDEAGVRAFWNWFGDSKVIDDQGRPLVVYHGSNAEISAFETSGGRGKTFGTGSFFSANPAVAATYAIGSEGMSSTPVYLRMETSAQFDAAGANWSRMGRATKADLPAVTVPDTDEALLAELEGRAPKAGATTKRKAKQSTLRKLFPNESVNDDDYFSTDDLSRWARGQGYDGAIFKSVVDRGPSGRFVTDAANDPSDLFVVFDPAQIKSINNAGSFDPADPRILFQNEGGNARGRIDFMSDSRAMITLFEGRDLSTLLHEGGHLWLEELRSDALSMAGGKVFGDWETVKAWFKREGIEVGDDGEIPTEAHELWARGMERYFMEGKAPSAVLEGAFSSFRAWLLRIYKLVTRLNSNIDNDVRKVFDRLIATDEAIGWAIHEADEKALFDSAAAANMTPHEFRAYRDLLEQSRGEAFDAVLYKTMERIRRERTKAYKDQRSRVRMEIADEVKARPEFVAIELIRGNGEEYLPLNRNSVIEAVGRDAIGALPRGRPGRPTVVDYGAGADLVAERAGFTDGKTMLEALLGVERRHRELVAMKDGRTVLDEAIDVATEQAMADLHPDIMDDGSIEEEALEAINGQSKAARLAQEVRQLAKSVDANPAPLDVVKSWAERVVREGRIVDQASAAAVDRHHKAEKSAAKAAERAYLDGDFETAFREKQKQLVANALYRAARDAKNNIDVVARRLDRLARSRGIKGMDPEYLDQIHGLLEQYDLRRRTAADIRERESFDRFAKRQEELGIEVFIPERLTMAGNVNFTRMRYEELVALDDAVQSLAHLGREKTRLKLAKEERDLDELIAEAEQAALGLPMRPWTAERNPKPSKLRGLDALLTKIEFLADQLDGDNPNGVFNRVLVREATRAANEKERLVTEVVDPLAKLYVDAPKAQQKRWGQRVAVPEFISINPETKALEATTFLRSELIAVALNIGNTSNLEKMLVGETMALPELQRDANAWTEEKVMAVLARELDAADWKFVETVWSQINKLWPDIVRSEREITGITPEKIEGRTVETPFGPIQGGYYPIVYDTTRSQVAADNADGDAARLLGQIGRSVGTPKGHTITRTGAAMPITFSLERVLFNHINRVATRIAYGRYVRDVLKFISHPRIRRLVDQHVGLEYYRQLKPWLQRQVNEAALDTNTMAALDRVFRKFRVNAQMVWMGFRVTTMISQLAGWSVSAKEIGPRWLLKGMKETARNMGEIRDWVFDQSPEMASRARAFDRDVRAFYLDSRSAGRREGKGLLDRLAQANHAAGLDKVRAAAFWGIGMIDVYLVSMPTWVGAYHKGIDGGMSVDEARAYADKAVRRSQGAGRAKDLAPIQDGGEAYRILTLAYSFFSVQYNQQREAVHSARAGDWRRASMNVFWLMMVGPLASAFLTGDWPDEEDQDIDGWVAWAMRKMFFGMWAGVPVVRDIAAKAERELSGKFAGEIQAPVYEAFAQIERPLSNAVKAAKGEEPSERWLRDTIAPLGYFLGLPTGQAGATAQYLYDLSEGRQNPDGVGDIAYGLAKGPQKGQE